MSYIIRGSDLCFVYYMYCTYMTFVCNTQVLLGLRLVEQYNSGCLGVDPDKRTLYFWKQTGFQEHNISPTGQDTCNRPLTLGHFKSLSASLSAEANPCCVYYTTGTAAGWSVCSRSQTSCWINTVHMDAGRDNSHVLIGPSPTGFKEPYSKLCLSRRPGLVL